MLRIRVPGGKLNSRQLKKENSPKAMPEDFRHHYQAEYIA
jgi:hypothetical protein